MKEYYNVIADIEELKYFFDNYLVKPLDGESLMAVHSARAKKLTEKERKNTGLNRAEMFHTEISKKRRDKEYTWKDFLSFISKFETNKYAYLSEKNEPYPDKSLVLYLCINPSSEAASVRDTFERISSFNSELIQAAINGSKKGIENSVWKLSSITSHIKSCHAQNISRKVWVDFDVDATINEKAIDIIKNISNKFFSMSNYFIIKTNGGVHIEVKREAIKFNPNNFIAALKEGLIDYDISEIIRNVNNMIPIPGTFQYGNVIKIIR